MQVQDLWSVRGLIITVSLYMTVFFLYLTYSQYVVYQWIKEVHKVTPKLIDVKRKIFHNEATVKDAEFLIDPSSFIKFDKVTNVKTGVFWKYQKIFNYIHSFQQFSPIARDLKIHVDPNSTRSQKHCATSMWVIKDYCHKSLQWMIEFGFNISSIERPLILTGMFTSCLALVSAYVFVTA